MRSVLIRWSGTKAIRTLVAGTAMLGVVQAASARDFGGVHEFFSSMSSGAGTQQMEPAAAPAPELRQAPAARPVERSVRPVERSVRRWSPPRTAPARTLTVRLHRPKIVRANQIAQAAARPGKISIFEDKTLRRGDAVMTLKGIRIFAGSKSWPYQDADFVALADAGQMDKGLQKALLDLDRSPHR